MIDRTHRFSPKENAKKKLDFDALKIYNFFMMEALSNQTEASRFQSYNLPFVIHPSMPWTI